MWVVHIWRSIWYALCGWHNWCVFHRWDGQDERLVFFFEFVSLLLLLLLIFTPKIFKNLYFRSVTSTLRCVDWHSTKAGEHFRYEVRPCLVRLWSDRYIIVLNYVALPTEACEKCQKASPRKTLWLLEMLECSDVRHSDVIRSCVDIVTGIWL